MDIPRNTVPKVNNYSDKLGDFVETFSLELTDNYGAIGANRMKLVTGSATQADLEIPVAFVSYNGDYYLVTDDFVYKGGNEPNDPFTKMTGGSAPAGDLTESLSDATLFNGAMYVSGADNIFKLSGSTWSEPVTTQLTSARPHLLATLGANSGTETRMYVTDDYDQIHSVNTSDTIAATGSFTMDFALGGGWTITMLEAGTDSLWVGFTDTDSGRGMVFEWDGVTENTPTRAIPLNTGVAAGCVLDGVPYVLDIRGHLLRYSGYTFTEVDKLPFTVPFSMDGAHSGTNLRFVHPNGMTTTDRGTILINIYNFTEATGVYQDSAPSGVYEYDPQVGLHHKYAYSTSAVGATTTTDLGQHRITDAGAILFSPAVTPSATTNGTILVGAGYKTSPTVTAYGVFTNDTLKTTQGYGYFVTPKLFGTQIQETWKQIYSVHDEIINAADKIVVKYRIREKNSVAASSNWLTSTSFTTTTDVSDFAVGDEVTVLEGTGAGQTMHIVEIQTSATTWTITVDANTLASTGAFTALFQNYKKLGEATNAENLQYKLFTIAEKNISPWIQVKVELYLTGREMHKIRVVNSNNINT